MIFQVLIFGCACFAQKLRPCAISWQCHELGVILSHAASLDNSTVTETALFAKASALTRYATEDIKVQAALNRINDASDRAGLLSAFRDIDALVNQRRLLALQIKESLNSPFSLSTAYALAMEFAPLRFPFDPVPENIRRLRESTGRFEKLGGRNSTELAFRLSALLRRDYRRTLPSPQLPGYLETLEARYGDIDRPTISWEYDRGFFSQITPARNVFLFLSKYGNELIESRLRDMMDANSTLLSIRLIDPDVPKINADLPLPILLFIGAGSLRAVVVDTEVETVSVKIKKFLQ